MLTSHSDDSLNPLDASPTPFANVTPRRILLVEDHESTAIVLQRLLLRHGHYVWVALRFHEALEIATREKIEVIICDLDLPDGDGCSLLREIHKQSPIPGIVLSGHGTSADIQRSHEAGFKAHLLKPFDISEIENAIEHIFASAQS